MKKYIDTAEALEICKKAGVGISRPTMISWAIKYGLGKKIGGRWKIDPEKLNKFLQEA